VAKFLELGSDIPHIHQFNPVRVLLDGIEMVAGDAATADEGEPDFPVNNHRVVMHRELITS
jgi:hypothetical protein